MDHTSSCWFKVAASILIVVTLVGLWPSEADAGFFDFIKKAVSAVAKGVSKAATTVAKGVAKAATTVAKGVAKAARTVANEVAKAAAFMAERLLWENMLKNMFHTA